MSCRAGDTKGFILLDDTPDWKTWKNQATHACYMNFATRGTPLKVISMNLLHEDSNNTLMYQGQLYVTEYVKICSKIYYIYNNTRPCAATMIFQYTIQNSTTDKTLPPLILIIVPIFIGTNNTAAQYLTQTLPTQAIQANYYSLQDLIRGNPMLGYMTCIDIGTSCSVNTMVYTMIGSGITISDLSMFNKIDSALKLDAPIIGNCKTTPTNSSPATTKRYKSTDITNIITYYSTAIISPPFNTSTKLSTAEYQCQPFDQTKNLQRDPRGVDRVSLKSIIQQSDSANQIGFGISFQDLTAVWGPIIAIVSSFAIIGLMLFIPRLFPEKARRIGIRPPGRQPTELN
jgi:hypothetical protein